MKKVSRSMMFMLLLLVAALVLAACGGGGGAAPKPAAQGDATKGKSAFDGTCVSCHGPDAKGLPGLGKDLTTSEFVAKQTDKQLVDFIKKGRPASDPANTNKVDMPPKGGNPALTENDLTNIVAFIRSIHLK